MADFEPTPGRCKFRRLRHKPVLRLALLLVPQAGGLSWPTCCETLFDQEFVRLRMGKWACAI